MAYVHRRRRLCGHLTGSRDLGSRARVDRVPGGLLRRGTSTRRTREKTRAPELTTRDTSADVPRLGDQGGRTSTSRPAGLIRDDPVDRSPGATTTEPVATLNGGDDGARYTSTVDVDLGSASDRSDQGLPEVQRLTWWEG